jgi:hypothetical protein
LVALSLAVAAGSANAVTYSLTDWQALISGFGGGSPTTAIDLFNTNGTYQIHTTLGYLQSIPVANQQAFVSAFNNLLQTPTCANSVNTGGGNVNFGSTACFNQALQLYTLLGLQVGPTPTPNTQTLNQVAPAVSTQVQRATSILQATTISNALSSIGNPHAAAGPRRVALSNKGGMAAGNDTPSWNVWFNVSDSDLANKSNYDGGTQNYIGGIDYSINKSFVVGLSLGQDRTKINLNSFNMKSDGFMVAPYLSYQINDVFSADASIGYAEGDTSYNGGVTGKQDFTRNFGAINLNGNWWFNNWQLSGKTSYITAGERMKAFDNNAGGTYKMEQLRLGAQLGYWTEHFMPYFGVTYINDLKTPAAPDGNTAITDKPGKDAYLLSLGVNIFANKAVIGGIVYSSEQRSNSKNNTLMANIGYRF